MNREETINAVAVKDIFLILLFTPISRLSMMVDNQKEPKKQVLQQQLPKEQREKSSNKL